MRVEEIRGVCVCGGKKQRGKTKKKNVFGWNQIR